MLFYTYKITNRVNLKSYYGWTNKSPEDRLAVHRYEAERGSPLLLHNAMRKYGFENFDVEPTKVHPDRESATRDEIRLIAEHKTNHCRYSGIGYNMTDGGEGVSGFKRTDKQKAASSRVITERNLSLKGKTYEEIYGNKAVEQKRKRGNSNRGKKRSPEAIERNRRAKLGNKNGCFATKVTFSDGSVVVYPSRTKARKALGIKTHTTLSSIATGRRWRNGKYETYNSPYDFTIEFFRTKI